MLYKSLIFFIVFHSSEQTDFQLKKLIERYVQCVPYKTKNNLKKKNPEKIISHGNLVLL